MPKMPACCASSSAAACPPPSASRAAVFRCASTSPLPHEYNKAMSRQRIMLVDDHEVVRLGLKALIERQPNMEVVAEASTAPEAVAKSLAFKPDAIVMDIRMTGSSGIDACREITAAQPEVKVIMLTSYADDERS